MNRAAQDLSMSPATASARIAKLEEALGFRLFNRTTRAVSLTSDGAAFLPYAQDMVDTLDNGLSTVRGDKASPRGRLRMTMPGSFGRMHIIPYMATFQERYPDIKLDLQLSDNVLDVIEGAFDLIIRNAALADSSLIARKLTTDERKLVASPDYLAAYGTPQTPQDILNHKCITLGTHTLWRFANGQTISAPPTTRASDGEAVRMLAETGMGITIKSLWNAHQALKDGRLVEVLPEFPLENQAAIWALYPPTQIVPPKVRVMIDYLLSIFTPTPPWTDPE